MTTPRDPFTDLPDPARPPEPDRHTGHRGHSWMMIACCVPMLAIAIVLVATGAVAGISFLLVAVMCTAMMAAMMAGMGRGGDNHH